MIDNKEKFRHLESLFVGDIHQEECEISWINQYDKYGELLRVLPNLRILKIKGSEGLSLADLQGDPPEHTSLEELQIVCGGLPGNIVTELKNAKLPNLKKLILYMGVEGYGLECSVKDLTALADKDLFPSLKTLGFVNSEEQDDIVEMLLSRDILPQLEELDISCGCLTDRGGQMILDAKDRLSGLKKINADYHYMSQGMMKKLKALPFEVIVTHQQENNDYMSPVFTE